MVRPNRESFGAFLLRDRAGQKWKATSNRRRRSRRGDCRSSARCEWLWLRSSFPTERIRADVCRNGSGIEKQNRSPRESNCHAARSSPRNRKLTRRLRRRRRCSWSSWRARRGRTSRSAARGADLIADFLNPDATHFIENCNNITMPRHSFGTDRYFDVRVRGVELEQPWQNLIVLNILSVEAHRVARAHAD